MAKRKKAKRVYTRKPKTIALPQAVTHVQVLSEASADVTRHDVTHGHPFVHFTRVSRLWNTHLVNRFGLGCAQLTAADVAVMMIDFKKGALVQSPNLAKLWQDIAGLAACGAEAR